MKFHMRLRLRLKCLNELKDKIFKINEKKNQMKIYYYDKTETDEYYRDMKAICRENIKNRREIKQLMLIENRREKARAQEK